MEKMHGVITAMVTPFTADDHIDVATLRAYTEYLIAKGVHCLYPCGTTGEHALRDHQKWRQYGRVQGGDGLPRSASRPHEGPSAGSHGRRVRRSVPEAGRIS